MLNGTTHTDPPMTPPDGDGGAALQIALLDQQVRQVRADVASLRRDVADLAKLAQQARGAGVALVVIFTVVTAGPRVLDWLRPAPQAASVQR